MGIANQNVGGTEIHVPFPRPSSSWAGRSRLIDRVLELFEGEVVFLVYGPAGIGKTELVYEIAKESGWAVDDSVVLSLSRTSTIGEVCRALRLVLELEPVESTDLSDVAGALESRPLLVLLDDVHHLDPDAAIDMLTYMARHLRSTRMFVTSRCRLPWPTAAPTPTIIRVGSLTALEGTELANKLASRLGLPSGKVSFDRPCSPLEVMRAVSPDGDAGDPLADAVAELPDDIRAALCLASVVDGGANTADVCGAATTELVDRFFISISGDVVRVEPIVLAALAVAVDDDELNAARREAAALYRERFRSAGGADPAAAVVAIRQLIATGEGDEGLALFKEARPTMVAAGVDHLLLDDLEVLRTARPDDAFEIELEIADILVRRARVRGAEQVVTSLSERPESATSARYWLVAGSVAERLGELLLAEQRYRKARELAGDAVERYRAALKLADVASMRNAADEARPLLEEARDDAAQGIKLARWDWSQALRHLVGERFDRAVVALSSARRAIPAEEQALASMVHFFELVARVESDDINGARERFDEVIAPAHAAGVITDEMASMGSGIILCAAGAAPAARSELSEVYRTLSTQEDRLGASVAGHYLAMTLLALGELNGARDIFATITSTAEAAGMESLALRGRALHCAVLVSKGKVDFARKRLEGLLESTEFTPNGRAIARRTLARALALQGDLPAARAQLDTALDECGGSGAFAPVVAAIDLTRAEIEIMGGDPAVVIEHARRARHYYSDAGRAWHEARASLALAAGYVARGRDPDQVGAEREVTRATALAEQHRYEPLHMQCSLVEAALAKRRQDPERAHKLLMAGLRQARTVGGDRIEVQAQRAALTPGGDIAVLPGVRNIVRFLGLEGGARYEIADRHGVRPASAAEVEREHERRELVVDVGSAVITMKSRSKTIKGRPTACALLAKLIVAGGDIDAETLYCDVWESQEYHPLKHRNTLYVTINRVRRSLKKVFDDRPIIETVPGGWRIADDVDACVVRSPTD